MLIREKDKLKIQYLAGKIFSKPLQILAYGSRVNGEAHDTSDLDLVIVSKDQTPIDIDEFGRFKDSLINSNIPILIQVMDWNRMPSSFKHNILLNNEELFSS